MSRALNLTVAPSDVTVAAAKHGARITSIEPLYPAGTRVVFANEAAAVRFAQLFRTKIVAGPVVRTPLRTRSAASR